MYVIWFVTLANARNSLLGRRTITYNMRKFTVSHNVTVCLYGVLPFKVSCNCKFTEHIRLKLIKANRCLHVLRSLRKEQYSQVEMDHLFKSIVLPNFTYCLSVYGASEPDLNIIQHFLNRCHKHRFVSFPVSIPLRIFYIDRTVTF